MKGKIKGQNRADHLITAAATSHLVRREAREEAHQRH